MKRLAEKIGSKGLVVGSLVAPVWPPTGGGSSMGSNGDRGAFLTQVRKACAIGKKLKDLGIRRYGIVRIDSAADPADWAKDPAGNTERIAETFRQAADIAEDYGERLAAEGEICWGGMHSVARNVELLEMVDRPETVGFQADMAHTLLFTMGYNAPDDRILPENFDWSDRRALDEGLKKMTNVLRPWTIDFHVAQNDATVKGSGSHDKTGRHCLPHDPNGKLDIVRHAGFWLRDDDGRVERKTRSHLLGRLHVPERRHDRAADVERRAAASWPRFARRTAGTTVEALNIGLVGYGFMGRTHSNAYRQAPMFFDLPWKPVLKAVAARNEERVKAFSGTGAMSRTTPNGAISWRARTSISIDIASPNDTHHDIAIAAAKAGKMVMCEKPLGRNAKEAAAMVAAVEKAGCRTASGTTTVSCQR